jgi:hypothetical protein
MLYLVSSLNVKEITMKKVSIISLSLLLIAPITNADMTVEELSKYQGAASCVDRIFFEDGYDEGDKDRVKIISIMLDKVGLPAFNESLYEKKIKIDRDAYMDGYSACDEHWDFINAKAKELGLAPEGE